MNHLGELICRRNATSADTTVWEGVCAGTAAGSVDSAAVALPWTVPMVLFGVHAASACAACNWVLSKNKLLAGVHVAECILPRPDLESMLGHLVQHAEHPWMTTSCT
jgi:hypothetical protein